MSPQQVSGQEPTHGVERNTLLTPAARQHTIQALMDKITIVLRYLFCLVGAGALLYVFSYPDAILPPNPAMDEISGLHLYSLKPFMWVLPVLFMELVGCCGPGRNLVWFGALFTVFGAALVLYPVLAAYWPEYVAPTFNYQGGMMTTGLIHYSAFLGISFAFRKVLLSYMFPAKELQDQIEVGYVSATALNPEKARTIKEIAAETLPARHHFNFKSGDSRMALRWKLFMRRMFLRSMIANACIAGGIGLLLLWFFLFPQPTPEEALQRDMARMFEHRITPHGHPLATKAAVHAAARVMKHISDSESLSGMTRRQAEQWLALDKVHPGYRAWLRDERNIKLASVNNLYENRTRFLTVTDGRCICVLYIRTNEADGSIVVAELQDAGWDATADEHRRRIGTDWGAFFN